MHCQSHLENSPWTVMHAGVLGWSGWGNSHILSSFSLIGWGHFLKHPCMFKALFISTEAAHKNEATGIYSWITLNLEKGGKKGRNSSWLLLRKTMVNCCRKIKRSGVGQNWIRNPIEPHWDLTRLFQFTSICWASISLLCICDSDP